jgi:hypothetical protein
MEAIRETDVVDQPKYLYSKVLTVAVRRELPGRPTGFTSIDQNVHHQGSGSFLHGLFTPMLGWTTPTRFARSRVGFEHSNVGSSTPAWVRTLQRRFRTLQRRFRTLQRGLPDLWVIWVPDRPVEQKLSWCRSEYQDFCVCSRNGKDM